MRAFLSRLAEALVDKADPSGRGSATRLSLLWLSLVAGIAVLYLAVRHGEQPDWPFAFWLSLLTLVWALKRALHGATSREAVGLVGKLLGRFGEGQQRLPSMAEQEESSRREVEGQDG